MKRFAAVALREVSERRFVLVAAAASAVLPFLVPLLPGVPADQAIATRSVVALVFSCAFGLGGSLLVGASVVGRELAERRLSFHFAQPLAAPVVWGGKLVGGLALVLLSELVILFPTSVLNGAFPGLPGISLDTPVLWAILLLAVPFFLFAWIGSVALRSRSPWLVVDLVLLWGLPGLLFVIVRRLLRYGHGPEPSWLIGAVSALLVALLAATLAQVVAGRTDARRGHGAQSLTLWGLLLVATAGFAIQAERTIDPGVANLVRAWAGPAGSGGETVFVEGSAKADGSGAVLYVRNIRTGREHVLPMSWETTASAEASRAVLATRPFLSKKDVALEAIDLATGEGVTMTLPGSEWPTGFALSPDGRRLATVVGGICSVVELPSLGLLASARVPSGKAWIYRPVFVTADRVRLHPYGMAYRKAGEPREVSDPDVAELRVSSKSVRSLCRYPVAAIPFRSVKPQYGLPTEPYFRLLTSPDRSRVLVLAFGAARSVRLLEAETGRVLAAFDEPGNGGVPVAAFLADGRAVVAEWVPGGRRLVVLSPDGDRLAEAVLASGDRNVRFASEPAPGLLAVGTSQEPKDDGWRWSLVDLRTGRLRPLEVEPLHRAWWNDGEDVFPPPGSPATRLAHEKGTGRLVLFDPATGETKPLTRGKAAGK